MPTTTNNEVIGLKHIIVYYLHHWKMFLGAFLFSLILAIMYLVYYPKTYEIVSRIRIQNNSELSSGGMALGEAAGMMKSFGLGGSSSDMIIMDDEVATLSSHDMLSNVVVRLGLNAEYIKPYTWRYRMYEKTPLVLTADSATQAGLNQTIEFYVKVTPSGGVSVKGETSSQNQSYSFSSLPAAVIFGHYSFMLNYGPGYKKGEPINLEVKMTPAGWIADNLADDLLFDTYSKNSNIIECFYTDYEKKRGLDLLTALVGEYNLREDSIKNKNVHKTIQFYDDRINKIIVDLTNVELAIESFKIKNKMTNMEYDVQFYVDQMKDLQTKIIELEAQSYAINFIESFVKDSANKYNLVPVLMTVQEGEKGGALTKYNEALVERQRLLQSSKKENPLLSTMDKQLDQMRESVNLTIRNAQESIGLTVRDLKSKETLILNKMGDVPIQEREYLEFKRQQEIYQGVYLILLQKREEAMLKLGQDKDRALVVDAAFVKSLPVAPRKLYAAIGLLLLTLIIPVTYLFGKDLFFSLKEEYIKTKQS